MAEHMIGFRQAEGFDVGKHRFHIKLVVLKRINMAHGVVFQQSIREALATPIYCGAGLATFAKIHRGSAIFFHVFCAASTDKNCSLCFGDRPMANANTDPVHSPKPVAFPIGLFCYTS